MFFEKRDEGVILHIKLTPNASKSGVLGTYQDEKGIHWLKVQVTTIPEDGKANKALINILSKTWKTPKTSFSFLHGETDRYKVLYIKDPSLLEKLVAL